VKITQAYGVGVPELVILPRAGAQIKIKGRSSVENLGPELELLQFER